MTQMPLTIGRIHFIGIGGIGMSGIAEVLHTLGHQVSGTDLSDNPNVQRLRRMGVKVWIGHQAEHVQGATVAVASSAIKPDNPEIIAARENFIPVVQRAEMLAELMRLKWSVAVGGTHGKTTTTSLIAQMLDMAGMDPTVINGGIINAYGTNARLGKGGWIIAEADESDGSFTRLPATIAVITNIDPEHMNFYGSFDALRQAFRTFVHNIPFYGFAIACIDHPEIQSLIGQVSDRRFVTYGLSPQADIRATDISSGPRGTSFTVHVAHRSETERQMEGVLLPMHGEHNVRNSLAAIAVALEMDIEEDTIRRGLMEFRGVKRRFTLTGTAGGVSIIDDYAHHPVEITAVLKAARAATTGNVIAVVQPHRYTRLQTLFEDFCACFNDANTVIVADVHPAGEQPIEGINREALVQGLKVRGHRDVLSLNRQDELAALVQSRSRSGDLVICMGAGNITQWAHALPEQLRTLQNSEKRSL